MFSFTWLVALLLMLPVTNVLAKEESTPKVETTAFASESDNVIYIDATKVSASELDTMVREAQDGINSVVVSWGEATAVIKPIDELEVIPYFNVNKTYSLKTTHWHFIDDDYLLINNNLRVTNKTGNPGAIDIKIVYPDYLDITTVYYWGLNAGYYTDFSLTTFRTVELWLSASNVNGDYYITAKNS